MVEISATQAKKLIKNATFQWLITICSHTLAPYYFEDSIRKGAGKAERCDVLLL